MTTLSKGKMFSGAIWASAGKLLSLACNFVYTAILARAISPSDNGVYLVALTTIVIVAGVGALGMDQIVVRFAGMPAARESKAVLRHVIGLCLSIVTLGGLLVALAFLLLGPKAFQSILAMPGLVPYTGMLAAWVFFATLQRQFAETFRGLNDVRMATLAGGMRNGGVLNAIAVCTGMFALWLAGKLTLSTALLTMLGASIAISALSAIVLWKRLHGGGSPEVSRPAPILRAGIALHEGWPIGLAGFIVILNNMGSMWLASPLDKPEHVALFGIAQRVVQLLITPMMIINAILPPIIAELHASGQMQRLERVVKSIGGLVLFPSMVMLAILIIAGRPLLHLMYGAYYEAAYPVLILLCVGQTINIATGAWQIVLPMTGSKHQLLTSSVIAVFTQFVLGWVLGGPMGLGILGVAIGYCTSVIMTNLVGMILVHRKLGIWTYASLNWTMVRDAVGMLSARVTRRLAWQRS